jgi:hypothetical protein
LAATGVILAHDVATLLLLLRAGFVESFNISVAAALIMYEAQQQRIRKLGAAGDLTAQQQEQLLAAFLLRGVVSALCCLCSSLAAVASMAYGRSTKASAYGKLKAALHKLIR